MSDTGVSESLPFQDGCVIKRCSKCLEVKPRSEFNKEHGRERAYCKICHRKMSKEHASKNRAAVKQYQKAWRDANREKTRQYARATYSKMSKEQIAKKAAYNKKRFLERKYGMTQADWDRQLSEQGGICAICRIPGRLGKHGKLAVDHCHETGKVRGLLCTSCNVSIGILGETRANIARVLDYVTNGWHPGLGLPTEVQRNFVFDSRARKRASKNRGLVLGGENAETGDHT